MGPSLERLLLACLAGLLVLSCAAGPEVESRAPRSADERGYLGVSLRMTSEDQARALGYAKRLVRVDMVLEGSPAKRGGLERGDIILAFEGEHVFDDSKLQRRVMALSAGDEVTLLLLREGERRQAIVMLGLRPDLEALLKQHELGAEAPALDVVVFPGGASLRLEELEGRVVVVDFWATWCGPCLDAIPRLEALQAQYGEQGLSVVGVSGEESETLSRYLELHPAGYEMAWDPERKAHALWQVMALPSLFVVDREGRLRGRFSGADSWDAVEAELRGLLDSP